MLIAIAVTITAATRTPVPSKSLLPYLRMNMAFDPSWDTPFGLWICLRGVTRDAIIASTHDLAHRTSRAARRFIVETSAKNARCHDDFRGLLLRGRGILPPQRW
jgi:hypothetical protein